MSHCTNKRKTVVDQWHFEWCWRFIIAGLLKKKSGVRMIKLAECARSLETCLGRNIV